MSNKTIYILIAIALVLFWWAGLSFLFHFSKDTGKKIQFDCAYASFHPDYTLTVKQLCRGKA